MLRPVKEIPFHFKMFQDSIGGVFEGDYTHKKYKILTVTTETNVSIFLIEEGANNLWVIVEYPDYSGDPPTKTIQ